MPGIMKLSSAMEQFILDFAQYTNVGSIELDDDGRVEIAYDDIEMTLLCTGADTIALMHAVDSRKLPEVESLSDLFLAANYETVLQGRGQIAADLNSASYVWVQTFPLAGLTVPLLLNNLATAAQEVKNLYTSFEVDADTADLDPDDVSNDRDWSSSEHSDASSFVLIRG